MVGRSFLSSSNFIKAGGRPTYGSDSSGKVVKTAKRMSSSDKLQKSLSTSTLPTTTWDSSNSSMDAVMADMGLPTVAQTSGAISRDGKNAEFSVLPTHTKNDDLRSKKNTDQPIVDKGESETSKKITPVMSYGMMCSEKAKKEFKTRAVYASSLHGKRPHASRESPEAKRQSKDNVKEENAQVCKNRFDNEHKNDCLVKKTDSIRTWEMAEEEIDNDEPRKSFHWGLKKKTKSESKVDPDSGKTEKDNILSDILNEIKTDLPVEIPKHSSSGMLKKKKTLQISKEPNVHDCRPSEDPVTLMSASSDLAAMEMNEKEADDALDDIMSELKETLTQQNQRSANRKRVGRPTSVVKAKKQFSRRLNMGKAVIAESPPEHRKNVPGSANNDRKCVGRQEDTDSQTEECLDPLVMDNKLGKLCISYEHFL